jgi:hypothetical protein
MNIKDLLFSLLLIILTSCGGSDSNDSADNSESESSYTTQALLGPVVNADVEIYNATDLSAGQLCRSQTDDSADLELAGRISIPADCVDQEGLYLLLVNGGSDIDADDDGVLDEAPTSVNGHFHTILTGAQLISGEAKVTVLTEVAYQNVRYLLASGASQTQILQGLDSSAQFLLKQDLNHDGVIDHLDLDSWHPRLDREMTRPSLEQLQLVIQDIHQNRSTAGNAVKLFDTIEPSVSEFTDLAQVDRVLIGDQRLYAADDMGLSVVDISDPDNLQLMHRVDNITWGDIKGMRLVGDWLYVQNGLNDVYSISLFNISDRDNPVLSGTDIYHPDGFDLNYFTVEGDYGYAALHRVNFPNDYDRISHDFRLDILDLSDPTHPILVSSLDLDTFGSAIAVAGTRLYVGTDVGPYLEPGGLSVIDISNPESPSLISYLELISVTDLQVIGDRGYATASSELSGDANSVITLLDLTDDNAPTVIGSIDTSYEQWDVKQLLIDGEKGYLATSDGISVYDFSLPATPREVDRIITKGATNNLAQSGSIIYALIDGFGLQIFDMSGGSSLEPSPAIVARIDLQDGEEITVSDENRAYLLAGQDYSRRLASLDFSDLQDVKVSSTETLPELYQNPLVVDQILYVTSSFDGLSLFDISDPQAIGLYSHYDQSVIEFGTAIAISGSRAVVGGGKFSEDYTVDSLLAVLDVQQSTDPLLLSQITVHAQPDDIAIKDDVVYVLDSVQGLTTYRISSTNELSKLGSLTATDLYPSGIILSGQYGFISYYGGLISLLDISDPAAPNEILSIDTQGDIADIQLSDNLLYIAGISGNIQVLNVEEPESPKFVGNFHATSQVRAITIINGHLIVVTQDELLVANLPVETVP